MTEEGDDKNGTKFREEEEDDHKMKKNKKRKVEKLMAYRKKL